MAVKRRAVLALVSLTLGCATRTAVTPPREPEVRSTTPALPPPPTEALEVQQAPVEEFLIVTDQGALAIRGVDGRERSLFSGPVSDAYYDDRLELVWIVSDDRLSVLDLRSPSLATVPIANQLSISRLEIARDDDHGVLLEDNCDVPFLTLEWTEKPRFDGFIDDEEPVFDPEGLRWLAAERTRPFRPQPAPERHKFAEPVLPLPAARLDCEDPKACARRVNFGAFGLDLVIVQDRLGGDCWVKGCVLYDPVAEQFATPPRPENFGPLTETALGPCGVYRFNPSGTAFLLDDLLCVKDRGCEKVGREVLGWRVPGAWVGEAGNVVNEEE